MLLDGVVPPEMKVSTYSMRPVSEGRSSLTAKNASSALWFSNAAASVLAGWFFSSLKRRLNS